ncbi:hypothetical protein Acsp05_43900 [Actinokineospora sp. NBRC 105648]|nr:hypothetical protein Acsp05_43900 [Actinokineospora sp. NBRC 105648]
MVVGILAAAEPKRPIIGRPRTTSSAPATRCTSSPAAAANTAGPPSAVIFAATSAGTVPRCLMKPGAISVEVAGDTTSGRSATRADHQAWSAVDFSDDWYAFCSSR